MLTIERQPLNGAAEWTRLCDSQAIPRNHTNTNTCCIRALMPTLISFGSRAMALRQSLYLLALNKEHVVSHSRVSCESTKSRIRAARVSSSTDRRRAPQSGSRSKFDCMLSTIDADKLVQLCEAERKAAARVGRRFERNPRSARVRERAPMLSVRMREAPSSVFVQSSRQGFLRIYCPSPM